MIIRCYGARGSIPVSGDDYRKYGGDTTCIEIRTQNDEIIIIDAGSGIRRLGNRLLEEKRFDVHLLFTHSHWDHILGFPFFKPIYDKRTRVHLIGCPLAQGDIKKLIARSMSLPYFPFLFDELRSEIIYTPECVEMYEIDSMKIAPINLNHPNLGSGFKFVEDDKTFVFLTDNELGHPHHGGRTPEEYRTFSEGADLLIHDAEYTPKEYIQTRAWGHSTYIDALNLAIEAEVARFGLFHHNQDRTDYEQDQIVSDCREILLSKHIEMDCFALTQDTELIL
ncbi:Metal-dependent hydrolases of the beta-lactamase superfamily I [Olavius algarvensis associated proteobacterium Delta 3]|nr:Metal-dependent hydrolases of the beta-lactamase superfamily I [Olavius algarvensis associated proteobacterium Delta 3]